ncbi:unnamed protein product [Protopolystoma xenopodis]|uniref:Uncharacterized protein n=1 Tax=Protopolystoma xenopodis TaxID=117903 RepID=A0A3S5BSM3_9PLAT|nr:unnamed protein product [Protopolystoma xenopodis]
MISTLKSASGLGVSTGRASPLSRVVNICNHPATSSSAFFAVPSSPSTRRYRTSGQRKAFSAQEAASSSSGSGSHETPGLPRHRYELEAGDIHRPVVTASVDGQDMYPVSSDDEELDVKEQREGEISRVMNLKGHHQPRTVTNDAVIHNSTNDASHSPGFHRPDDTTGPKKKCRLDEEKQGGQKQWSKTGSPKVIAEFSSPNGARGGTEAEERNLVCQTATKGGKFATGEAIPLPPQTDLTCSSSSVNIVGTSGVSTNATFGKADSDSSLEEGEAKDDDDEEEEYEEDNDEEASDDGSENFHDRPDSTSRRKNRTSSISHSSPFASCDSLTDSESPENNGLTKLSRREYINSHGDPPRRRRLSRNCASPRSHTRVLQRLHLARCRDFSDHRHRRLADVDIEQGESGRDRSDSDSASITSSREFEVEIDNRLSSSAADIDSSIKHNHHHQDKSRRSPACTQAVDNSRSSRVQNKVIATFGKQDHQDQSSGRGSTGDETGGLGDRAREDEDETALFDIMHSSIRGHLPSRRRHARKHAHYDRQGRCRSRLESGSPCRMSAFDELLTRSQLDSRISDQRVCLNDVASLTPRSLAAVDVEQQLFFLPHTSKANISGCGQLASFTVGAGGTGHQMRHLGDELLAAATTPSALSLFASLESAAPPAMLER